jgi:hypothetical protein
MKVKETYKKIITGTLIFSFVFLSFGQVFASETTDAEDAAALKAAIEKSNAQAQSNNTQTQKIDSQVQGLNVTTKSGTTTNSAGTNAATELLGCTAGGLLARVIAGGISVLLQGLVGDAVGALLNVPVDQGRSNLGKGMALQQAAETGTHIFGVPTGVSWNGIAWCIVNTIISYIADATIQWANNGFNGNPAFIQNPERFFKGIADREAGSFIQELAYDTTGINVCQPFRARIAIGLASAYGDSYQRRAGCSLEEIRQNINDFAQNPISIGTTNNSARDRRLDNYWGKLLNSSRDSNNMIGSYILANQAMYARIDKANNTATFEIGLNKGWLSTKKCLDDKKPETCNIVTPGSILQSSLEKTLNIPKDRLVLATKFDQVVTVIVNNLIKVALNKVLENREEGSVDQSSGITVR